MFVQVIQGQVADREKAHAALDKWTRELAPSATGWLGTTAGVTEDGTLIRRHGRRRQRRLRKLDALLADRT